MRLIVKQATDGIQGRILVPRSKYHVQRALMLASLARGISRIIGLSDPRQAREMISALRALGTRIEPDGHDLVVLGGPYCPDKPEVSVGGSDATLFTLTGLACLSESPITFVGRRAFQRRPLRPLLNALADLGVRISAPTGCPPITVHPGRPTGGEARIPGMLTGWISGLLMLAPFATGPTVINVEGEFNERARVELTVRMMREFGLVVGVSTNGRLFTVEPNQRAVPATVVMPPDVGAAAFGLAAAALHPADVMLQGLAAEVDHPESDLLSIVAGMGVPMTTEPGADGVRVRHDGVRLDATRVDCRDLPGALPVLSVLGALAKGTTRFDNVAHVRAKEPDRITAMSQLNRMGARLELDGDRLSCTGVNQLTGADLSSCNDPRVLMALALAGTVAQGETRLTFPNAYRAAYPGFLDDMREIGLAMSLARGPDGPAKVTPGFASVSGLARMPVSGRPEAFGTSAPTALAVDDPNRGRRRTVSWSDLEERVNRIATLLLELGVRRGESVAFQLPDQTEFVVLANAVARIGATGCPLMADARRRETVLLLRASGARVLVVSASHGDRDHAAAAVELVAAEPTLALEQLLVMPGTGGRREGAAIIVRLR